MVAAYVERGHLRRVLPAWTGPEYELNALFPRGRVQSPKVRAFVDFLVDRLNFDADYMQGLCPGAQCSEVVAQPEVAVVARKKTAAREVVQAGEVAEPA
jgi:hypothetical protein